MTGKILELKYKDNITGLEITKITVRDFSTRIAKWKDKIGKTDTVQLSLDTTPKCWLIEPGRDFNSIDEAKKYYLDNLKMCLEDTLELLKDID